MNKLAELLKAVRLLVEKGVATADEKAAIKVQLKELEPAEQEVAAPETDKVEELPEDAPADDAAAVETEKMIRNLFEKQGARITTELKGEIKTFITEQIESLKGRKTVAGVTLKIDETKYKEFVERVKVGKKADMSMEIPVGALVKAVGPMGIVDSITGEYPQAELESGVSRVPQREPFVQELVTVGTITSNLDAWIEVTDGEGNPAPVAELALIPAKDYDFARKTAEVKKVGVHAKYSAEMAEDLPSLISEIRNYLLVDLRKLIDVQLLSGDGITDNLVGILENATAFAAGQLENSVSTPNRFDAIEAGVNQVIVALHQPNYCVVHPTDRAKMRLTKGTDGHYILPPFISVDGTVVSGVRLVANTGITVGKFLVGDFTKSSVKYRRAVTLEMTNTDQDDFVKDRFTVKATARLVQRVKENDYEAFVYGDFAVAIAALDEESA